MKISISRLLLSLGTLSLALSGCGDSGTGTGTSATVSTGTVAKVVSRTTGGQLTVNGTDYITVGAAVTINGSLATPVDLKPGMQATISGAINGSSGTAATIEVESELEGMVEQVDTAANRFVLLGRTVTVNDQTQFEGVTSLSGISVGQTVEVYGLPDASGLVVASRIEVKNYADMQQLSGAVLGLDPVAKRFSIRSIVIDYSSARLPAEPLANELNVKVHGTYANGVFTATSVRIRHMHHTNGRIELEGLVTSHDSATGSFTINGQKVQITASTVFTHGTAADIVSGIKVEIEGEIANGILFAKKIEIDHEHGSPVVTSPTTPPLTPPVTPPVTPPATPPVTPPTALPGKSVYDANCAGCHRLGSYDAAGSAPNLSGKGGVIPGKLAGGHMGMGLSPQQITDLSAFANAN